LTYKATVSFTRRTVWCLLYSILTRNEEKFKRNESRVYS